MDYTAAPLEKLIEEFGKFQGVGRKGATRMAYQVLSLSLIHISEPTRRS